MIRQKDFLVIVIRLLLGYIFLSAGLCKLTHGHFGQIIGPPMLEDMLAKHGLGLFARVVAVLQVVCGILLLSQRFSTLGAIMLVPINLSIIAVTISLDWNGTPYVNGFFIFLNLVLLIYDWHKLKVIILPGSAATVKQTPLDAHNQNPFNIAGIILAFAALVASRYSFTLTNIFAVAAFAAIGYSIIQIKPLSKIKVIIVVLIMLNMMLITMARALGPIAQKLVLVNTILILVLIGLSFVKFFNPDKKIAIY